MAQDNDKHSTEMEDNFAPDEFRQGVGDPEDTWHETPGGHCKMEIDLDHDVIGDLVTMWVENNLEPASIELYHESCERLDPQMYPMEALWDAVVNDQIIHALRAKIEDAESKAEDV